MRFLFVTLLLLNAGCHSLSMYRTPEKVTAASTVEHDEYEGSTWVQAPLVWYQPWSRDHKAQLRTLINRGGRRTNQLYVIYSYVDWAFLERASDRHQKRFETLVISRDVDRYGISEHVAVKLSDEYLESAAVTGLDIQLSGQRDHTVVELPPHYVQGFLAKLESVRATSLTAP